jgi:hypothetical protein
MKRHVVVAAVCAAILLIIPIPSRAEQANQWVEYTVFKESSIAKDIHTTLLGTADLVVAGLTKNKSGSVNDFVDLFQNGPDPINRVLGNWSRRDGGRVPGAGWIGLNKQGNFQYGGKMRLEDQAANTYTSAYAAWSSEVVTNFPFTVTRFSANHRVEAGPINPPGLVQGIARAASLADDPVVFRVTERTPFTLDIKIEDVHMAALDGEDRFAELNWFGAFGSGTIVGENIIDGTMRQRARIIEDGEWFASSIEILSIDTILDPGEYWYAFGTSSLVGAVPEPATLLILGPAAAALVARRSRRRR